MEESNAHPRFLNVFINHIDHMLRILNFTGTINKEGVEELWFSQLQDIVIHHRVSTKVLMVFSSHQWLDNPDEVVSFIFLKTQKELVAFKKSFQETETHLSRPQAYVGAHRFGKDYRPFDSLMDALAQLADLIEKTETIISGSDRKQRLKELRSHLRDQIMNYLECVHACLKIQDDVVACTSHYLALTGESLLELDEFFAHDHEQSH